MRLTKIRHEQGQVLIVTALAVLVILAIGAIVVDLANFYEHRRHLQTQADAAALAGGGSWKLPCTQDVDDEIERQALKFAGGHNADRHRTENAPFTPLVPVNDQVGTTSATDVHVTLNSSYWTGPPGPLNYTDPGSSCSARVLDVKITETNTKAFFGLLRPDIKAKARIEVRDAVSVPALPFVVASPAFAKCAWAVWVDDSTGAELAVQELTHPGPTDPEFDNPLVWVGRVPVSLTLPLAGPDIGVRLRIGNCTDPNRQEEYFERTANGQPWGLLFGQTYQVGSVSGVQTPKARDVVLQTSSTSGCATTSFVSSATTCFVDVSANVDFGGGGDPQVRARIGNALPVDLVPGVGAGQWVGLEFPVAPGSGLNNLTLTWARGSGEWCNNGAATCSGPRLKTCTTPAFAPANPCQGILGVQQRIYSADENSGPIVGASIINNGAPASSFIEGSPTPPLSVRFVLEALDTKVNSPTTVIRASVQDSNNRSGAADCVGGSNLRDDIVGGCIGYVENQRYPVSPFCPTPALSPVDCIPGQSGNINGQIRQGMIQKFGCTPNNWPDPQPGDPRIATVMVSYLGALSRRSGNPQQEYPILAFFSFYITGWDGEANSNDQSCRWNEAFPKTGSDNDTLWGHFFDYAVPPSGGTPGEDLCAPDPVGTCVYTLVE